MTQKQKHRKQQEFQMQDSGQPVYVDTVDEDTEGYDYDYVDASDIRRNGAAQLPPSRNARY